MLLRTLGAIPAEGLSHDPLVRKKVLLRNGEVPQLTNFSQAYFAPGQKTTAHVHKDMWEVYLLEEGEGSIIVNGKSHLLTTGSCIVIAPGELHEFSTKKGMRITYFGILEPAGAE
jgi:mannose-6-phosphate isomerase-like protein (cupin superfamily)